MKKILPVFKDDRDKTIIVTMIIASVFFMFIPALLVMLFAKKYISESSQEIAKSFFNFELILFLISLIFTIPIIGWILGFILTPIIMVFDIIICIINLCAVSKEKETEIPVLYEFV